MKTLITTLLFFLSLQTFATEFAKVTCYNHSGDIISKGLFKYEKKDFVLLGENGFSFYGENLSKVDRSAHGVFLSGVAVTIGPCKKGDPEVVNVKENLVCASGKLEGVEKVEKRKCFLGASNPF